MADTIEPINGDLINDNRSIQWVFTESLANPGLIGYSVIRPDFTIETDRAFVGVGQTMTFTIQATDIGQTDYTWYINSDPIDSSDDQSLSYSFGSSNTHSVAVTATHNNQYLDDLCAEIEVTVIEAAIIVDGQTSEPPIIGVDEVVELSAEILPDNLDTSDFQYDWQVISPVISGTLDHITVTTMYTQADDYIVGLMITHTKLIEPIILTKTLTVSDTPQGFALNERGNTLKSVSPKKIIISNSDIAQAVALPELPEPLCEELGVFTEPITNNGVRAEWRFVISGTMRISETKSIGVHNNGDLTYFPLISK